MKNTVVEPVHEAASLRFYLLVSQIPLSELMWTLRRGVLREWRSDREFEPYWPAINQMLTDDLASFQKRIAAMESAARAVGELDGYDFNAWREQREYDRNHALDHLP